MLIKDILKPEDKKYLALIDEYEEFHCGWYNVPFMALDKKTTSAILNLLCLDDIYICGVVDLDGEYPENFYKVKNTAYCIHAFKAVPLNHCRKAFIHYTGMNRSKLDISEYFINLELQDNIDKMLYNINNNNDPWHICFKVSKDKKYIEFSEFTDVF